jgi:hypothetical protein
MRVAWPAGRARGEEGAAEIGGPAARAGDDPPRRPVERCEPCIEDAGLVERLERAGVVLQMNLKTRGPLERPAPIGPDLARDTVGAQERERAPSDGAARGVEVQTDAPAAAQVDAPRPADEGGELGEAAARLARLDRRQLAANVLGEAQISTPSSPSRRRL